MTDRDIDEKLKKAAEKVEVPDMLDPDVMRLRLEARGRRSEKEAGQKSDLVSSGGRTAKISGRDEADAAAMAADLSAKTAAEKDGAKRRRRILATAAAAALLVTSSIWLTYEHFEKQLEEAGTSLEEVAADTKEEAAAGTEDGVFARHDAGTMFTVAKSDRAYEKYVKKELKARDTSTKTDEAAMETQSVEDTAKTDEAQDSASSESASESVKDSGAPTGPTSGGDYSETNTLVEGVDEADIVKTDGKYIYRLIGESVKVTKADGTALSACDDINVTNDTIAAVRKKGSGKSGEKEAADSVSVPKKVADAIESCAVNVSEMFVRDGKLIVLGNLYKYGGGINVGIESPEGVAAQDSYDSDTKLLAIFTYDITDPEKAGLLSVNCIDGYFDSARITSDGKLVIFADNWIEDEDRAFPEIDGKQFSADSIYLPSRGLSQTMIATYDMDDSGLKAIDSCMVLNDSCRQYVTDDAIYLYGSDFSTEVPATSVARFTLKDGKIDATGAATVAGFVTDEFALRTVGENLFILTTSYGGNTTSNGLYVYDGDMKRRGALTGLAPGEEIYSARYIGNISYFVTYRQIDPLFAVDISDPDKPKLLGSLKITGFSDYLHPWGDGRLLGIGYETDPASGEQKGIKLTMFDISDPVNPTEAGTTVIPLKYCDLFTYDHRAVLASPEKNLLGFGYDGTESDDADWNYTYAFYSWNEETKTFDVKYSMEENDTGMAMQDMRGLYIGDTLYVAGVDGVSVQGGDKLLY